MKKFIAAVLSAALTLSCVSVSSFAEETPSSAYTIDSNKYVVSEVAPLTTVSAFKANFTGYDVQVENVDGSVMADNAYATENVYAIIDGKRYNIDVNFPYDAVKYYGRNYRTDEEVLFSIKSKSFNSTPGVGQEVITNSGFAYAQSSYKLGDVASTAPTVADSCRTIVTKETRNGKPVYELKNNAPRYAFLRSHYSASTSESAANQTALTTATKDKISVTTVTFKTDKMGNVSLHHNAAGADANGFKADAGFDRFTYSTYAQYIPNAVHFTEDGRIKVGGIYHNTITVADQRTPAYDTGKTWEANKEYTVSVVQKPRATWGADGLVYGIYVNGEKVFPNDNITGPGNGYVKKSDGTYSMNTRDSSKYKYYGGISSILIGAAPMNNNNNEDITLTLSDVKVYTVGTSSDYKSTADMPITLTNTENITVNENDLTITNSIAQTVAEFKAIYPDVVIGVYKDEKTLAADTEYLKTGMIVKIASPDGLQAREYKLTATDPVLPPESSVYTIDSTEKIISMVEPLTTVSVFKNNITAKEIDVINIDGTVMADDAYATENVWARINGELYSIDVKYAYDPINDNGSLLADGSELYGYDKNATEIDNVTMTDTGIDRVQVYPKLGYAKENPAPKNTENQTVKATKLTWNGEPVYVMENDSNNYAYLRSHYSDSSSIYAATALRGMTYVNKPIVTTVKFIADKEGTVSLHHNLPGTDAWGDFRADGGMDRLIYGSHNPYVGNAVHFMEDGSIKIGGTYANLDYVSYRQPIHETNMTWTPGKEYTVTVVQRMANKDGAYGYVAGVYINGTKVFPFSNSLSTSKNEFSYQSSGNYADTYAMTTRDKAGKYGGGISSVMFGSAPKTAGDNMTVTVSDFKVYTPSVYNPSVDVAIELVSNDDLIKVDNDNAVIYAMNPVSLDSFETDAKFIIEGNYLKAVSADGLVSKTYTIIREVDVITGFCKSAENDTEIKALADANGTICFKALVDKSQDLSDIEPKIVLAVYNNNTFVDCIIAEGIAYNEETTVYKAEYDISEYSDEDNLEIRGFVWDGFTDLNPLTQKSVIR